MALNELTLLPPPGEEILRTAPCMNQPQQNTLPHALSYCSWDVQNNEKIEKERFWFLYSNLRRAFDEFYSFVATFNVLSQLSGFRKNHSCQSLLIKITDYLLNNMDKGKIIGLTMIDLRKAFDLVDHATLLQTQHYLCDDNAISCSTTSWWQCNIVVQFISYR
jgi:hypothetical protein